MNNDISLLIISIVFGLLNLLIVWFAIILLIRIVKYIVGGLNYCANFLNGGWLNLGISIGFASLLDSDIIANILYYFIRSTFRLFVDFPNTLKSLWHTEIIGACQGSLTGDCIIVSVTGLLKEWGEQVYTRLISDFLWKISLQDFVTFILIVSILSPYRLKYKAYQNS